MLVPPLDAAQLNQIQDRWTFGWPQRQLLGALVTLLGDDTPTHVDAWQDSREDHSVWKVIALTTTRIVYVDGKATKGGSPELGAAYTRPAAQIKELRIVGTVGIGGDPPTCGPSRWRVEFPDGVTVTFPIDEAVARASWERATAAAGQLVTAVGR